MIDPDKVDQVFYLIKDMESETDQINAAAAFLSDPNQATRFVVHNFKPMRSIRNNEDGQFLLADQCAVLAFLDRGMVDNFLVNAEISFGNNGYTQMHKVPGGGEAGDVPVNTYIFKDIPRHKMVDLLAEKMKVLL